MERRHHPSGSESQIVPCLHALGSLLYDAPAIVDCGLILPALERHGGPLERSRGLEGGQPERPGSIRHPGERGVGECELPVVEGDGVGHPVDERGLERRRGQPLQAGQRRLARVTCLDRRQPRAEADVRAISAVALSTPNEWLRIAVLTLLEGVGWPIASAILHWAHRDPYPILDVRALWSAGLDRIPSSFEFELWRRYTLWSRATASRHGVSMRTLDKALWQYSKDRQR